MVEVSHQTLHVFLLVGWMAWERFRCNIDCENDPDNCVR